MYAGYQLDQHRETQADANDSAVDRHISANEDDSVWIDEAVSEYVFDSGNEERESAYRQALHMIYHRAAATPMRTIIIAAIKEKAQKEIDAAAESFDNAA